MSEHMYLTDEELSIIGDCSPTSPIAIAVHRIIADLDAVRAELNVTREERQSALDALAVALHERNQRDEEIARLRQCAKYESDAAAQAVTQLDRMRTALEDANSIADSYARNKTAMTLALRRAGLPDSWLSGWDAKFDRIRALGPQPAQPEKPKPQTFREGHPVYVCRQCSKQYKEHGKNEECPVGERGKEVK